MTRGAQAAGISEAAEATPGGQHESVTLSTKTSTPRARSLTATFKRVLTPLGESQPAKRQRKKNEGKARARAVCRLDAERHERYKETERVRKRRAAPATAWAEPTFWQLPHEASRTEESSSGQLREQVQLTPRGSRAHSTEHTSPGGTTRLEQYTSPADARATREQRCGWRSRIAHARIEARGLVERYWVECMHCGRSQHIMPDGCMFPHSLRDTMNRAERAEYREGPAYAEHGWLCSGSRMHYGPCDVESEED